MHLQILATHLVSSELSTSPILFGAAKGLSLGSNCQASSVSLLLLCPELNYAVKILWTCCGGLMHNVAEQTGLLCACCDANGCAKTGSLRARWSSQAQEQCMMHHKYIQLKVGRHILYSRGAVEFQVIHTLAHVKSHKYMQYVQWQLS